MDLYFEKIIIRLRETLATASEVIEYSRSVNMKTSTGEGRFGCG